MGSKNTSRSLMRPVTGLWMEFDCRLRSYYVQQDMPELRPGLRLGFRLEEVAQGACLNSRRVFLAARAKCTGSFPQSLIQRLQFQLTLVNLNGPDVLKIEALGCIVLVFLAESPFPSPTPSPTLECQDVRNVVIQMHLHKLTFAYSGVGRQHYTTRSKSNL